MIIFNSSMTHQCRFPGFFDHIKMTSNNKSSHRCAQNMLYMKTHLLKEHIYFIGYNYTYYQKRPPIHVNTYQCSFNVCQEWRVWSTPVGINIKGFVSSDFGMFLLLDYCIENERGSVGMPLCRVLINISFKSSKIVYFSQNCYFHVM